MAEPHRLGEFGGPGECRERVALDLDERDRRIGNLARGRADAVPRILPSLVAEATGFASRVRHELSIFEELLEPIQRPVNGGRQGLQIRFDERSPSPRLGGQHHEQRSGVDGAVVATAGGERASAAMAAQLVQDFPRLFVRSGIVSSSLKVSEGEQHAASERGVEGECHPCREQRVATEHGHEPRCSCRNQHSVRVVIVNDV